jgi:TRAP-type mannitol/chloroaromatic compound transport system permease large subunit
VEPSWELLDIYRGMMPFMVLQMLGVATIYFFPEVVLWLPKLLFG